MTVTAVIQIALYHQATQSDARKLIKAATKNTGSGILLPYLAISFKSSSSTEDDTFFILLGIRFIQQLIRAEFNLKATLEKAYPAST